MNLNEVLETLRTVNEKIQKTNKVMRKYNERQQDILAESKRIQAKLDETNKKIRETFVQPQSTVRVKAVKPPAFVHWSQKTGKA